MTGHQTDHDKQLVRAGKYIVLASGLCLLSIITGLLALQRRWPILSGTACAATGCIGVVAAAKATNECDIANAIEDKMDVPPAVDRDSGDFWTQQRRDEVSRRPSNLRGR